VLLSGYGYNAELRNAESKMWNEKCGMTLIGRGKKPLTAGFPQITTPVSQPASW